MAFLSKNIGNTYIFEASMDTNKPNKVTNISSGVQGQAEDSIGSSATDAGGYMTVGSGQAPVKSNIPVLKLMKAGILARTYFDKTAFKNDLLFI